MVHLAPCVTVHGESRRRVVVALEVQEEVPARHVGVVQEAVVESPALPSFGIAMV